MNNASGCEQKVLAQPALQCSHRYFVLADLGDHNCACAPPGSDCEYGSPEVRTAKVASLYRVATPALPGGAVVKPPLPPTSSHDDASHVTDPKNGLRPKWQPPKGGYCYKHGGDWSQCAAPHRPYPASTPAELRVRPGPMCLHEPYCWMQLDWQSADPPAWQCGTTQRLLFWQMSFHNSAASDSVALLEQGLGVHHAAHICGAKSAELLGTIYNYSFTQCAMANKQAFDMSWKVKASSKLRDAKAQYLHETPEFEKVDALLFSFSASMWENYMSVADDKVLVLSLWHRMNMFRCSPDEARDNIRAAQALASTQAKRPHILGPQTLYDVEYMRHYTGINPIFLPTTLIDAIGVRGRRMWNETSKSFLWNAHRGVPTELTSLAETSAHAYAGAPRNYAMEDLALYAGVVYLPYSVTNVRTLWP